MAWNSEIVLMVRHLIGDLCGTDYSDDRLEETILVAAQLLIVEESLGFDYTIDVDAVTLTPDPTESPRDSIFIALVTLKAVCIISNGVLRTKAALSGLRIKDGMGEIETRGLFDSWLKIAQDACKTYEDAKFQLAMGNYQNAKAILTPFSGPNVRFADGYWNDLRNRNL